jgi:DNA-binding response OmpR family regulator
MEAVDLLVLDDDLDMRTFIAHAAAKAGLSCSLAADFESFKSRDSPSVGLVVLDLVMPDTDGIEVLRYLARLNANTGLIIITASGNSVLRTASELASAQGLRVVGVLAKPFVLNDFVSLLGRTVPNARESTVKANVDLNESELRRGLAAGEMDVYYQPKVSLRNRAFYAVETLVRWIRPGHDDVSPAVFVPFAESCGLIDELTQTVMRQSFAQCAAWNKAGLTVKLSINLSAYSLTELDLTDRIASLVVEHGIDPRQVIIEVTESWVMADLTTAMDILTRLRLKGFGLSLDDYGTGYSTLEQVNRIPFS